MSRQTLDQIRAAYAWNCVKDCSGDYENLAKGAGALVMTNGLMATLAFYQGKGKDHHKKLLNHLTGWLCERGLTPSADYVQVMECLYKGSSADYRAATEEALALIRWLRQLAPAARTEKETCE